MSVVLNVEGLGKCYATYSSNLARFAEWFGFRAKHKTDYWAVRDVNLSLQQGQALALIGQNGAGKSTFLKLVTGTVRATTGRVNLGGRVSAILELGLGFNPDFTGRQNVFLSGGLMGFSSSELTSLIPGIEEFAEIGEFFDQPLRVYSSGMQARLAFAVATAVRPDLLIVDEVLSVGDSYFQHKSFDRIREFRKQGTSLLFVTHGMGDVRALCDRVILLDKGMIAKEGLPDEVVDYYNAMIAEKENAKLSIEQRRQKSGWLVTELGSREAVLESLRLKDADSGDQVQMARVGQRLLIESRVLVRMPIRRLVLGHRIMDRTGHIVWGTNTWHTRQVLENVSAGEVVTFKVAFDCTLGPGAYAICFGLTSSDTHLDNCYHKTDNALVFDVMNADKPVFIGTNWLDANIRIERFAEQGNRLCE
ncbi:MAG: ABC transporter ATP-binding protein [Sterolibacteriaceae bacterium]|nr:ABC transporter ATP-binding protein [Sterolibacteriaceae bacterium]